MLVGRPSPACFHLRLRLLLLRLLLWAREIPILLPEVDDQPILVQIILSVAKVLEEKVMDDRLDGREAIRGAN